ncbi:MAG TPA: amidohydrolase family protein [Acidimicrobiales bacterium]|jgi:predicted TIM-barrel fold metal-dependent hydrolase|nr:amidohydrolase family protein [Acidimicrobiales bacterium]
MVDQPTRVVDAHVHLWDPARTDWYPYLSHPLAPESADASRMFRPFDVDTYRAEAASWNVEKFINVAAATGSHSIEETIELDGAAAARGGPDAIIGGIPPTDTVAEALELLDRQMTARRFRGVRPMGRYEGPLPDVGVLDGLRERSLVFELMSHPDQLRAAAKQLASFDDLVVVVEHAGWPRSGSDEERALWREGIGALADLGNNVVCKLSGLAMPLEAISVDAFAPWLEHAIEAFGVDRCMFASNFPVDSMYGTFDELYGVFSTVTAGLDSESRSKLFAGNAEFIYRC